VLPGGEHACASITTARRGIIANNAIAASQPGGRAAECGLVRIVSESYEHCEGRAKQQHPERLATSLISGKKAAGMTSAIMS